MLRTQVVVLLVAIWPALASADDWRAFQVTADGVVVVSVYIGGEGPFAFLLDTGSSRSAISTDLALRLGARQVGETTVLTPSGRVVRPLTPLSRISLDGSPPAAALAMIVPERDLARGVHAEGILGADVLMRFVLTIDYERARISWKTTRALDDALTLPLATAGGRFVVSVTHPTCTAWCVPLKLIPDTGTDGVVLFNRPGDSLHFVTPLAASAVRSLAGVRPAQLVLIGASGLRDIELDGRIASLIDLPPEDSLQVDGLLPLHFFARVTLDGPGKTVTLVRRQ